MSSANYGPNISPDNQSHPPPPDDPPTPVPPSSTPTLPELSTTDTGFSLESILGPASS